MLCYWGDSLELSNNNKLIKLQNSVFFTFFFHLFKNKKSFCVVFRTLNPSPEVKILYHVRMLIKLDFFFFFSRTGEMLYAPSMRRRAPLVCGTLLLSQPYPLKLPSCLQAMTPRYVPPHRIFSSTCCGLTPVSPPLCGQSQGSGSTGLTHFSCAPYRIPTRS